MTNGNQNGSSCHDFLKCGCKKLSCKCYRSDLSCTGCPQTTVTWWKESENGRTKINEENNSNEHAFFIQSGPDWYCSRYTSGITEHSLKIYRFNKSDLGTYVAKAESSIGIVELKFIIKLDTD